MSAEPTTNPLPKISLLTANFVKMQKRKAAFGFTNHWLHLAKEELVEVNRANQVENPDMVIDLEPPPRLAAFTMRDLQGAYYLFSVMLGISIVVFLCECIMHSCKGINSGQHYYTLQSWDM